MVTGDECWISFFTMIDKRSNNMVWMTEDEHRSEVSKTSFRSRKRMFSIFFNTLGHVALDLMPQKATITATYYTTNVLPKVVSTFEKNARTRRRSEFFCSMITQHLIKLVWHRTTWRRKTCTLAGKFTLLI